MKIISDAETIASINEGAPWKNTLGRFSTEIFVPRPFDLIPYGKKAILQEAGITKFVNFYQTIQLPEKNYTDVEFAWLISFGLIRNGKIYLGGTSLLLVDDEGIQVEKAAEYVNETLIMHRGKEYRIFGFDFNRFPRAVVFEDYGPLDMGPITPDDIVLATDSGMVYSGDPELFMELMS